MDSTPVAMVDRVTLILASFSTRESQSLTGIVEQTGLPRSSVHRILQKLVRARWIERIDAEYCLGLGVFELGSLVARRSPVVQAARPFMQQLSEAERFVVHVAVLDGSDVIYLDKVGGPLAGRLPSRVGGRLPAHCTGVGKAILSRSAPDVVAKVLELGLIPRTGATIVDPAVFRSELEEIQAAGYAVDRGEAVQGLTCVAAPVSDGRRVAAISVSGPTHQVDTAQVRRNVMYVASQISKRINDAERVSEPASRHPGRSTG